MFGHEVIRGSDDMYMYLDGIIVSNHLGEVRSAHLRALFDVLSKLGVKINVQKFQLRKPSVTFLGLIFQSDGIAPSSDKTTAIRDHT